MEGAEVWIKDNIELQFITENGRNVFISARNHHLVGPQPSQQPESLLSSSGTACGFAFSTEPSEPIGDIKL